MRVYDGSYNETQYNVDLLRRKAQEIANVLPKLMEQTGAQVVVVRGKSGVSLAFATLMLIDFPIVVVRKPGENSHGSNIEGQNGLSFSRYLVLDDFVCSGATIRTIVQELEGFHDSAGLDAVGVERPRCVGVLEYCRSGYERANPRRGNMMSGEAPDSYLVQRYGVQTG